MLPTWQIEAFYESQVYETEVMHSPQVLISIPSNSDRMETSYVMNNVFKNSLQHGHVPLGNIIA